MSSLPPGMVLIAGALTLPLVPRRLRGAAFLVFPVLALLLLPFLESGTTANLSFLNYDLVVNRVDRLSLAFGYVFAIMTLVGGVYGFHLRDLGQQVAALLYAGGSLGVVFAGDLLTLFVFWEVMAVSSVYLIWARRTPESTGAGWRYLGVHLFGSSVLLAGILWQLSETWQLSGTVSLPFGLFSPGEGSVAAWLILFGFALNAAVPPLHAWLTDSYPEGTVTGSVFLSAFTTKTAVYALARGFGGWEVLVIAGTVMAVYGVVFAVLANDIRRLLAYHIVSQVGYMVAGVGLGTEVAINGAVAHAFAHILYKGLLFMGAGTVLHTTGRSKLTELGGLARLMPLTLLFYMVGAVSISGFPLFSGFVSKSMVVFAASDSHREVIALFLNVAAVGTFLSVGLKLPYFTWFGPRRGPTPAAPPPGMYWGMGLTSALCFAIGVYPAMLYNLLPFPVEYHPYAATHLMETVQLLLGTGLGFYLLLRWLQPHEAITLDTDWVYRRAARPAYRVAVLGLAQLFGGVEGMVGRGVRGVTRWAANPLGYFPVGAGWVERGAHPWSQAASDPQPFDPDRYRLPVGVALGLVLVAFISLAAWSLLVR